MIIKLLKIDTIKLENIYNEETVKLIRSFRCYKYSVEISNCFYSLHTGYSKM